MMCNTRVCLHTLLLVIFVLLPSIEPKTMTPSHMNDLQEAVDTADPGDIIKLFPRDYKGDFHITRSGAEGNPIKMIGMRKLGELSRIMGTRIGFRIHANHWHLEEMAVEGGNLSVEIIGNGNTLQSLSICRSKRGVHVTGDNNSIRSCWLNTGNAITIENGKGNRLESVSTFNNNSALNIKSGACCGKLKFTSFQGPVDIQGNNFDVSTATFQDEVNIGGCNNKIDSSSFKNLYITNVCSNGQRKNTVETASDTPFTRDINAIGDLPEICDYSAVAKLIPMSPWLSIMSALLLGASYALL